MSEEITDNDLTNIARGFDAPAKPDHLEKLQKQAQEREQEMEPEQKEESPVHEFLRDIEREEDELER